MTTERAYDPELRAVVPLLPVASEWDDMPAARAAMADMIRLATADLPPVDGVRYEDHRIPGAPGVPELRVRVYRPVDATEVLPAVLYVHGGGFCFGSIETEDRGAAATSAECDAVVVSVEYRLAPEHPYPAGLEDCYAALRWLASESSSLAIDPGRVAVMGSSAGGGLAAAVALLARDRGGPEICFQLLGMPELDDRLDTASMRAFDDTPLWNRPNAEVSWRYYLGDTPAEEAGYAAPSRRIDLSGLPPAYVSTMEFDPLRDEGILYALRLLEHGVSVELHQYPGTFHGSNLVTSAEVSKRSSAEMYDALRRGLSR